MKNKRGILRYKRFWILLVYAALLAWSGIYRYRLPEKGFQEGKNSVDVNALDGERILQKKIKLSYKEFGKDPESGTLPVILVHGSPGSSETFNRLAKVLDGRRLISVDLPGFGDSERFVPDYSIRAHARYLIELTEALGIKRAHFVGFSLGGGVILYADKMRPDLVESVSFVSSIGVQEYELFGSYAVNHAAHGVQLAFFWALYNLTPHFGVFDPMMLSYSWNFYQTDQRPIRELLLGVKQPFLLIHGTHDPLVPVEAARETARLVPQSEYHELDDNHFYVFLRPEKAARLLTDFFSRVELGKAATRDTASRERLERSSRLFVPSIFRARGVTAFSFFLFLAFIAFINEDVALIIGGVLAAQGRFGLTFPVVACLFGAAAAIVIYILAGRFRGARTFDNRWFSALFGRSEIESALERISSHRLRSVFLNRGSYGFRSSFYFLAGARRSSFLRFVFGSMLSVMIWAPLLTTAAYLFSRALTDSGAVPAVNTGALFSISLVVYVLLTLLFRRLEKRRGSFED